MFCTEIAATFVDSEYEAPPPADTELSDLLFTSRADDVIACRLFKQSLPGMVDVRTDGRRIWSARRIAGGWESYGPHAAATRPTAFGGGE